MKRLHLPMTMAVVLLLAACRGAGGPDSSQSASAGPSSDPTATPAASAAASAAPSEAATPSPSAAPSGSSEPTAFTVAPNADADALFLDRDDCENVDDGYRVEFPDAWWTNTAVGDVGPCSWFSPTFYEVDDPAQVPSEIAITITWMEGDSGSFEDPISRQFGIIGRTQPAVRVEYEGSGGRRYVYQVQLGPTPEEGPNLLVETSTEMGGDYELNKAVLDRIMATMELTGTIQ